LIKSQAWQLKDDSSDKEILSSSAGLVVQNFVRRRGVQIENKARIQRVVPASLGDTRCSRCAGQQ